MYADYFGLKEIPFSIAPDPQYLYLSKRHKDALAHLFYGIQSDGGFILLTGEVGTGKTTLCRCLLEQIPEDVETAFVLNPKLTVEELLATICDEFGIEYPEGAGVKILVDQLNTHLLDSHAASKRCVLIIDEAQNLSTEVLEQLRLLTNLETNQRKLLQIILLGQPELLDVLEQQELRQLSQRVTARYHLEALDYPETCEYIKHRLGVAGGDPTLFTRSALKRAFRLSGGIPRVINLICDRALLGAYAKTKNGVTPGIVGSAANEVLGRTATGFNGAVWVAIIALIAFGLAGYDQFAGTTQPETTPPLVIDTNEQPSANRASLRSARPTRAFHDPTVVNGHTTSHNAYHDLFALWGTAFEDQESPPCDLAANIGLRCYDTLTSLDDVFTLNRPAIIQFNDDWLTISAITPESVTLIAGEKQFEVSRADLQANWQGEAFIFWRVPPAYSAPLQLTDTGAAVDWLTIQLAIANGNEPVLETGKVFDENLAEQVRGFQASVGLAPNGIVDTLTWIHLNSVEAIGIPKLSAEQDRG